MSKENKELQYSIVRKGSKARDFTIRYKNECVPIEVKSKNGTAKSMRTVLKNDDVYHVGFGMKFGDYNMGKDGKLIIAPPLHIVFTK